MNRPDPKPRDPVVVATHRRAADGKPWYEYLDEAVQKHYRNVICYTEITAKGYATRVRMIDGTPLVPKLRRVICAFIAGWMANEEA